MDNQSIIKISSQGIKNWINVFKKFLKGYELDEQELNLGFVGILMIESSSQKEVLPREILLKFQEFKKYVYYNMGI